ncbi:hypothetical protein CRV24_010017 [Beauveria bassiana]|nr:hypothetical protein CRV24_010017 [Beauveria bassiana]KAH8708316.1 hypothetical protein HC256_010457 [Beauveria bassiana]KAH8708317.1 hypothetical protein HC256_010457 [Beauveria bassiana]
MQRHTFSNLQYAGNTRKRADQHAALLLSGDYRDGQILTTRSISLFVENMSLAIHQKETRFATYSPKQELILCYRILLWLLQPFTCPISCVPLCVVLKKTTAVQRHLDPMNGASAHIDMRWLQSTKH